MGVSILRSFFLILAAIVLAAMPARAANVLVFAASSTTNAIDELNSLYAERGHGTALASFGSSGIMARQIENGAPADIFVTADETWLDHLTRLDLVKPGGGVALARNRLVLIAPRGSRLRIKIRYAFPLAGKLGDGRLAIADPGHTPAGRYAKHALTTLGVWRELSRRAARTNNVRETLALVERGEAAAGIVYATDAAISRRVRTVATFPEASHPPIRYRAAIVTGRATADVKRYFEFLSSDPAAKVFLRHGFLVDPPEPRQ